MRNLKMIVLAFILMFALSSCNLGLDTTPPTTTVIDSEDTQTVQIQNEISKLVAKVSKSCVGIYAEGSDGASIGSGVIYKTEVESGSRRKAYVVTNKHVVEMTSMVNAKYKVYLGDDVYIGAKLLGKDLSVDLAILTFTYDQDKYDICALESFNSESTIPKIGSFAIAIGNPLDLENYNYTSMGMVSGMTRTEIVHSAPINPGNSGGGLFNLKGELLGINVSKIVYVESTSSNGEPNEIVVEGISYAIPIATVKEVIARLEAQG